VFSSLIRNFGDSHIFLVAVQENNTTKYKRTEENIFSLMTVSKVIARALSSASQSKVKLSWLDLRGSGLSVLERLTLEEALLRHDPLKRCWGIIGSHDPYHNKIISLHGGTHGDDYVSPLVHNTNCAVVMGIGGHPKKLLDIDTTKSDGVLVLKRFSGGGTVVVDHSSLWTTFICRTDALPHVKPYPRDIMKWSADAVFEPTFQLLNEEIKSQNQDVNVETPDFALKDNDYVFGDMKFGGNAQAIIGDGWLHHTSFLWDYVDGHMDYLLLPEKRPEYRGQRSHDEFLVKLSKYYETLNGGKNAFYQKVKKATEDVFDVDEVSFEEAFDLIQTELGGMETFFNGKCRTKVVEL